ncbi:MAG: hypothetical protein SVY41_01170 [Candidatus Nanohaloarchaea archaeon]|nr:hypothetical protein [Candidatus Nanohaloarchaea archaeon]
MPQPRYPGDLPRHLESYYDQLTSPGRTNHAVAEEVDKTGRLPENGRDCLLCEVPSGVDVLYADDNCYVVELEEMKGHDVRTLVASTDHGRPPSDPSLYRDRLLQETAPLVTAEQKQYAGVYARHGTFSGHYHIVGFDLCGDDLPGIHDAALYRVDGGTYDPDPVWIRPESERTATGEILLYNGQD